MLTRKCCKRSCSRGCRKAGRSQAYLGQSRFVADAPQAEHSAQDGSVAIVLDKPVPWSAFAVWLTLLVHAHGKSCCGSRRCWSRRLAEPGRARCHPPHVHPPRHLPARSKRPRMLALCRRSGLMRRIEPSLCVFPREPRRGRPMTREKHSIFYDSHQPNRTATSCARHKARFTDPTFGVGYRFCLDIPTAGHEARHGSSALRSCGEAGSKTLVRSGSTGEGFISLEGMTETTRFTHGGEVASVALSSILAVSPASAQKAEPCIAGSWELSGPIAHTGAAVRMGVETAVEEINEAGGVLGQKLPSSRMTIRANLPGPSITHAASAKRTTAS